MAELLAVSAMAKRMAAPWRIAIGKLLLARGAAAEHHREAATARKVRSATAGKKGLQRSNGLVSFFDAPLMQIIPIFVVW